MPAAKPLPNQRLDVITIGRSSVDLYGQQIGSRLEDIGSFAKSVGGSPSNMAIGTARLGLKSGLVTSVGDEQMGHYIIEQMQREGVDVSGIKIDKERLTALVLLSVESDKTFPLIFYRENCADAALDEADIDEAFIRRARAIVVTGTHFSKPNLDRMQRKAIGVAKANGMRIAFDIDYRPNLWGLAGHRAGEERYIASDRVSEHLKSVLADCDLIVGTEEEIRIAAGKDGVHEALTTIRALSKGLIVLKRGPMGCVLYPGAIPPKIDDGIVGQGFPIEVYNVLGAGDAFMSGFLSGWLRDLPLADCATRANACGAFAVSRLMCSPEYLTETELDYFLKHGSAHTALRTDEVINHIHWATTRRPRAAGLLAFAIDHRSQLEDMAITAGAPVERLGKLKQLAVEAAVRVAAGRGGFGMLIDEKHGRAALFAAEKAGLWIGRPVELPGSRPLRFEFGQDIGSQLVDWPVTHCIKALSFYNPDDPADLKADQQQKLLALFQASRKIGRELLIEIIAGKHGKMAEDTIARAVAELYRLGIKPDWWKLEPQTSLAAWTQTANVIKANDPWCRGVVLLGLDAPEAELQQAFDRVAGVEVIKGFAVGRTLFREAAKKWLAGEIDDAAAIDDMAGRFERLTTLWLRARGAKAA